MKRRIAAGLSILAVMGGVGWKLLTHPDTSAGLQEIRLIQGSEHAHPGPEQALAGIRIRLSPSDFALAVQDTEHEVPQISLAAE
jgi:hypothetical protein